jgi:hypothetical protein
MYNELSCLKLRNVKPVKMLALEMFGDESAVLNTFGGATLDLYVAKRKSGSAPIAAFTKSFGAQVDGTDHHAASYCAIAAHKVDGINYVAARLNPAAK